MNKQNLIVNGSGDYPGGLYRKISIRGEGTIVNDVESSVFHVYGTSRAAENVTTESVKVLGEASIKGNMYAENTLVMGTMAIGGDAELKKLKVLGSLDAGGGLRGQDAIIKGSVSAKGDVEYETFESSGGFEIKGLLNADQVKIALRFGESTAEEIGGAVITVNRKRNSLLRFGGKHGTLAAKTIEGDEIYLENTRADLVRGKQVNIGPGCQIGVVEYSNDFHQDADSVIKEVRKI